jgi:hypothetical protein
VRIVAGKEEAFRLSISNRTSAGTVFVTPEITDGPVNGPGNLAEYHLVALRFLAVRLYEPAPHARFRDPDLRMSLPAIAGRGLSILPGPEFVIFLSAEGHVKKRLLYAQVVAEMPVCSRRWWMDFVVPVRSSRPDHFRACE